MITENEIRIAMNELYRRVGTQKKLAELAGITQSTINAYLKGNAQLENMPLGVFIRLFQNMKIDYFGETVGEKSIDSIREKLLSVFDNLSFDQKVLCLSIVIANFPEKILKDSKK